ncbi:hypothetical protein [Oceanobacillus sp. CAU 1775]
MTLFLSIALVVNIFVSWKSYTILRRSRKLFSDRYAMVISLSASMVVGLVLSLIGTFILPFSFSILAIVFTSFGGVIGILFGSMVKLHSVLSGFFGGTMGGMTGAMVGAVVLDPTLCGLPLTSAGIIETNMIIFSIFMTVVFLLAFRIIIYSIRV